MRGFVRWWETLGRADRIVALSIGLSAPILIIDSAVWAAAVAYIVHEKTRVEIERLRVSRGTEARGTDAYGAETTGDRVDRADNVCARHMGGGADRAEWPVPTL